MLFPTGLFAAFFAVVFAAHWTTVLLRPSWVPAVLLLFNLVFFAGFSVEATGWLVALGLLTWGAGLGIGTASAPGIRRAWLVLGVATPLLWLGYLKYANFFLAEVVARLDPTLSASWLSVVHAVVTAGVSFYCFQAISYVVDVHRGHVRAERSPLNVLAYLTFFPHLAAGPIVRAAHFLPQLAAPPHPARIPVVMAGLLILGGLFKKTVMADGIATGLVDPVFLDPAGHGGGEALLAIYGFAVQIWCDFSGYSDMAIGIAALLGYHFPRNFDQPYRAVTFSEFWRRWHISLSRWLRDYLYIPLGGDRGGAGRTARNLLLTMILGGIWHGAAWTFVLWGALHGAALAVERLLGAARAPASPLSRALRWAVTFHVVVLLFALFRAKDMATFGALLRAVAEPWGDWQHATPRIVVLIAAGIALHFLPGDLRQRTEALLRRAPAPLLGALAGLVILLILLAGPEGVAAFLYFQF